MVRSTVIGNSIWDRGSGIADFVWLRCSQALTRERTHIRIPISDIPNQAVFAFLELMIAMFVLIILLSVAFPTYQRTVQHARESVLKETLWQMRRSINQYTADKV